MTEPTTPGAGVPSVPLAHPHVLTRYTRRFIGHRFCHHHRIPRGHAAPIIVGAFVASGIVMIAVSWVPSKTEFSAQGKHYLAVIHNPCAHSEVLDTTRCSSWGQKHWKWPDDKTLVKDAHDVCAVESAAPIARIDGSTPTGLAEVKSIPTLGGSLIKARYPNYFDLQVGVEEVAARNIYCPNVIKPVSEEL